MSSETTEKIVESYVRYIKHWATIANIKCEGQFEIDLLAVDVVKNKKFHIETGISISGGFSKLTGDIYSFNTLKQRTSQASQRRTLGYFRDRKFNSPGILSKLATFGFKEGNYERIIVSWGWNDSARKQADEAGIKLWDFRDIILEIAENSTGKTYFTDDTLRTLQLLVKANEEKSECQGVQF